MALRRKFLVDVYGCTINIVVCKDIKRSINSYMRKYDPGTDLLTEEVKGYFYCPGGVIDQYFVFFSSEHFDSETINHEKSHLVEEILIDRSIRPKGEVRAYLDGFISMKFSEIFKKSKLKIKN